MTANDSRRAHALLDGIINGHILGSKDVDHLRSFLPERPKQKTLEELRHEVYAAWSGTHGNEWLDDVDGDLETWLYELHAQLQGVEVTAPAHPEFLENEADYQKAPEGTIVAKDDISTAWIKRFGAWESTDGDRGVRCPNWKVGHRIILRWGWKK